MSRKWLILAALAALAVLAYAAAGPFLSIRRIESSIAERDYERLAEQIDFPAVRADLKRQLQHKLESDTPEFLRRIPFAEKLVTRLGGKALEQTIDPLMAAQLLYIMQGNHPDPDFGLGEWLDPQQVPESTSTEQVFHDARYRYIDSRTFVASVEHAGSGTYRFTFRRHGLRWKLSGIELPMLSANAP